MRTRREEKGIKYYTNIWPADSLLDYEGGSSNKHPMFTATQFQDKYLSGQKREKKRVLSHYRRIV